jgi:hypothetical protein
MGWPIFWAIFSQTHLVTLLAGPVDVSRLFGEFQRGKNNFLKADL